MLLDAVSIDDFNDHKIWVDTVLSGETNVERRYKLRAWLSESITIGEGRNVTYSQDDYPNHYASVKVAVEADMNAKSLPAASITRSSYVENGKSYFMTKLSNDYKLEDEGELLDTNDVIKLEITNPDNLLYFQYRDSKGNEDTTNNTSLDLTYIYNKNETIDIQVFTISKEDVNVSTDLKIKVTKNGSVVQEYVKHVNVVGNSFCKNNGITKLNECLLVMENHSKSVNEARSYIASKGAPDVNTTAPTYVYSEVLTENQEYTGYTGYPNWSLGEKYAFNSATGKFTLKQSNGTTNATTYAALSNNFVGKYTCGTSNNSYTGCSIIYKVDSVDTANNKVAGTKITFKQNGSMDSQVGLYKVADNDGDSYIFRGNVSNNNVKFGGYYWKIIRINGNGSIRMIFNGASTNATGNNAAIANNANGYGATYAFNLSPGGPTYVGYMNTESENYWTSAITTYSNFAEDTAYYFSNDFEEYNNDDNKQFKLKETGSFTSKVKDLTEMQLSGNLYTCSTTNTGKASDLICDRLIKVDSRKNNTQVNAYYITYSVQANNKADTEANEHDSNAKKQLELWYANKLMNNLANPDDETNLKVASEYIVDEVFCNDRSIYDTYTNESYTLANTYNSGYLLTSITYYSGRTRLIDATQGNKSATLICTNDNDKFSTTLSRGNGELSYPVGLITADEVALAGGKYNEMNSNFYLRTNSNFWTTTPSFFDSTHANAREFYVSTTGLLYNYFVTSGAGLRAVINLKPETLIGSGYGTMEEPYTIK